MGNQGSRPRPGCLQGASSGPPAAGEAPAASQEVTALQRTAAKAPACDVVISYHADDIALMRFIQGELESQKLTVFADVAEDDQKEEGKSGSAIVQAKVFVLILSPSSAQCRTCNREVQLAYISDKPIFPVTVRDHEDPELLKTMDFGLKLTLQPMEWIFFTNVDDKATPMKELIACLRKQMQALDDEAAGASEPEQPSGAGASSPGQPAAVEEIAKEHRRTRVTMHRTAKLTSDKSLVRGESGDQGVGPTVMRTFWDRNFEDEDSVAWFRFQQAFLEEYGDKLEQLVSSDQDTIQWILKLIQREVFDGKDSTTKASFMEFRGERPERNLFFKRISQLALESYSMHGVFSMDSSVRLAAVENLGKFSSAAVVEALLDLLDDPDANIRAVAAISLARTGAGQAKSIPRLIERLSDKDRLVREACCLSLGHLKATAAVSHIVNAWRNDFISHVRTAAEVALKNIGGEEAGRAIHMTEVLTKEIRELS